MSSKSLEINWIFTNQLHFGIFFSVGEVDAKSIAMTMASLANSGTAAKTNTVANGLDAQRMAAKPKEVSILMRKYSLQVFNSVKYM